MRFLHQVVCLSILWTASLGWALSGENDVKPAVNNNLEHLEFFLQTVGRSSDLAASFGHTILRVRNLIDKHDVGYNWGVFDFEDPNFLPNFIYGKIMYRMAVYSTANVLAGYRYEQRSVVEEKITLTPRQKARILDKIRWNSRRENLFFPYHYYFNNCSTKVRDLLDEAFDGAISRRFAPQMSNRTLRDVVRSHLTPSPFSVVGTEIIMTGDLEEKMPKWNEMFLPEILHQSLKQMGRITDEGVEVSGEPLLSQTETLLHYDDPRAFPISGFLLVNLLFAPIFLVGLLAGTKAFPIKKSYVKTVFQGISIALWGIFSSLFGCVITFLWFFSAHIHSRNNVNILYFFPLDFIWVWAGVLIVLGRNLQNMPWPVVHIVSWYTMCRIVMIIFAPMAYYSGIVRQDVHLVATLMVPALISANWVLSRSGGGFSKIISLHQGRA